MNNSYGGCDPLIAESLKRGEVTQIKTKTYVIDPVLMMQELVDRGYTVQANGRWSNTGFLDITPYMWKFCGKEITREHYWEPWMLIEKEEKGE